ncbi:hypothetical protein A2U01_0057298, partial [Trifolium medium]|nr:hypothetical protein [Trifolium medium]
MNVETSGTQERRVPDSVPSTPENNPVSCGSQKTADEGNKDNTQPDESEGPKFRDEEENSSADKTMADNTVIVNVEECDSEPQPKKSAPDGIAKRLRTRSGKVVVSTSASRKEEKSTKKTGLKPPLYGPK